MVKLFGKILRKNKSQKGGKVLGQGSFGCVIDSLNRNKDTVSKLINLDEVDENSPEMKEIVDEYTKGEIFRKNDPKNRFFLPVLTMERMSGKTSSKQVRKDLQTCGYSKDGNILNFSIKRGGKFQKIGIILSEKEILKSLLYSLHGAKKCVDQLNTGLFDIKPDNLLFSITHHNNEEYLHPTFIDFSSDFVLTSQQEFLNFFEKWGGSGNPTYYQYWSYEILTMIYMIFEQKGSKGMAEIEKKQAIQDFVSNIHNYHGFPRSKQIFDTDMQQYILTTIKQKDGYKKMMKDSMVWAISQSYYSLFQQKKSSNINILNKMSNNIPWKRLSLEQSIKQIESVLKMKSTMPQEVVINITKHKHKEQIYKIFGIGKKHVKKIGLLHKIFNMKIKKKKRRAKTITKSQKKAILKNKRLTKSQKYAILNRHAL